MGENINISQFSSKEEKEFSKRLREESKILKQYFNTRKFQYSEKSRIGLEVEGWLINEKHMPNPVNKKFLSTLASEKVVEELSKFNFEINLDPQVFQKNCFQKLYKELSSIWKSCQDNASKIEAYPMLIGIHPLIREQALNLEHMSDGDRYRALNDQLLKARKDKPIQIDIEGVDRFQSNLEHIMLEAATTSIQVHIQVNQDDVKRFYNSSLILSSPSVAIAANSPFLCGHDLWDETRIPLFEQAVHLASFRDRKGNSISRVTLGTGYIKNSLLEIFLENLNAYPPLIPILFNDKPENLRHLRFHNGTLWRWNRPLIGIDSKGVPHIRIEQRVMSSGPSIEDIISNIAFSVGLSSYFAKIDIPPEESMTFTDCKNNFYQAAKYGLNAKLRWFGKEINMDKLILENLLPKAKEGLELNAIDKAEIEFYIDGNIYQRVLKRQNGASWQRAFIENHGPNFQLLTEAYLNNQRKGLPVYKWTI